MIAAKVVNAVVLMIVTTLMNLMIVDAIVFKHHRLHRMRAANLPRLPHR
jgi:hypothetical protein